MERWMTLQDIMERYGCGPATARKYIKAMGGATKPYGALESQVIAWDRSRMQPARVMPEKKRVPKRPSGVWQPGMLIPRRKEA